MVSTSTLISIVYFSANLLLLLALGYYVKRKGEYDTIRSTAFFKDIWSQRKIYAPLIVHFYDTATDIGVVYYWYTLMKDEQAGRNYVSVDMEVFFWCGVSFLLFYRLCTLIGVIFLVYVHEPNFVWYDAVLALFDVYIFKTVYLSFKQAHDAMSKNAEIRKARAEQKKLEQQKQAVDPAHANETKQDPEAPQPPPAKATAAVGTVKEIEPDDLQKILQIAESITESMPQIMLQSVFVIRSYNDVLLRYSDDNNLLLISLSILASLISIANKFVGFDRDEMAEEARRLEPKRRCPRCINYWYILRIVWRVCDIASKFAVYVLVWVVLGGAWLGIWCAVAFMIWTALYKVGDVNLAFDGIRGAIFIAFVSMAGTLLYDIQDKFHVFKFVESVCGLCVIAVFATVDFECAICAESNQRQFDNDHDNNRMLMFFVVGCVGAVVEAVLYIVLRMNGV
eukprot:CAMPEP_0197081032 /NCGR_PEP_ID=MMETSP1384-20130603/214431_1 /TAXON_ID=29189 /ORGANISM="Ammonia sp." /LENGTH=451 /DNA_ID=CAMNT_0042519923 /DNA_START=17 /DNA_END=1369 /DNA_ORIENTATION=+